MPKLWNVHIHHNAAIATLSDKMVVEASAHSLLQKLVLQEMSNALTVQEMCIQMACNAQCCPHSILFTYHQADIDHITGLNASAKQAVR